MNCLTRCQRLLSFLQCLTNRPRYPGISLISLSASLISLSASLISSLSAAQLESETDNSRIRLAPNLARDPGVSRHRRDSESEGKQEGGGREKLPSPDTAHNKEVLRLAYQQA
jgi:hypothetical protein